MNNFLLSVLLIFVSLNVFSQQSDLEVRKIRRIETAYKDILKLNYTQQQLNDSIFPVLNQNKTVIAPNFPAEINFVSPLDINSVALKNWMLDFPEEYKNYMIYLEKFIRKHL